MERITSIEELCEYAIELCERSAELHCEYKWLWMRNPVLTRGSARFQRVCGQLYEESVVYLERNREAGQP